MNNKENTKLYRVTFLLLIFILIIPFIQQSVKVAYVVPLKGDVRISKSPDFNLNAWFDNSFQNAAENYINDNFGFRPEFVRLKNQIDYWFFNAVNTKGVVIGKEDYLYEWSYIDEYMGRNFIGKQKADSMITRFITVSDILRSMNKEIVFLFASGKASYFPNYFPDSVDISTKTLSNYQYLSESIELTNLNHIDFNSWFLKMKDTISFPLYTKGGIHWTKYGELFVTDSIISYTEDIFNTTLPHYQVEEITISYFPKYRDNDIGEALNLILPHSVEPLAYPKVKVRQKQSDAKLRAIFVADSYFWEMFNEGLTQKIFNNGQFWYYGKEIYSKEPGWELLKVEEVDLKHEIEKNDIIFIMQTEATINWFTFGFIDKLYDVLTDSLYNYNIEKIKKYETQLIKNKIKISPDWLKLVEEKANKRGISIDEMIELDAKYIVDTEIIKGLNR